MMTLTKVILWVFAIGIILIIAIHIAHAEPAPQDTLITFTDGADLQRQVREIRAVCDTTDGAWVEDSSSRTYYPVLIRCRVNIRIEWYKNPHQAINFDPIIGEALITWEWTE